jgi:signal transduction histidine kinase
MILIDLKLALFIVLLLAVGGGAAAWWGTRRAIQRPRGLNIRLAGIPDELPIGLALLHSNGTVLQANAEARRLVPDLDVLPTLVRDTYAGPSSGLAGHPVALRWWRYPLDQQITLLLLLDHSEQQRLISRQQGFVGQLAHELRTPLTALIAHLEIVRRSATSAEVRTRSLDTLQHEIHRLARLLRDLLELQRLETTSDLALRGTNLLLVVEDALAQVFPQAEQRGIELNLEAAAALPLALADTDRLKQVFLNLLDNAIKYGRPGDSITVKINPIPGGLRCIIADSGPGIGATDLPQVRQPLYRGRNDVEGSGIGLALVDEILRKHHATLTIESETSAGQSGTMCSWTLLAVEDDKARK